MCYKVNIMVFGRRLETRDHTHQETIYCGTATLASIHRSGSSATVRAVNMQSYGMTGKSILDSFGDVIIIIGPTWTHGGKLHYVTDSKISCTLQSSVC